jgi:hypothetical protein
MHWRKVNLSVNPEALQRGEWILTRLLGEMIPDVLELNQRLNGLSGKSVPMPSNRMK